MTAVARTIVNAMSVDVEDYFQVSAFESHIPRGDWDSLECRVERNTLRILELFDAAGISATFFVLGWIAERYPNLVREIASAGHEIASHGWSHVRATEQTQVEFSKDVAKTRTLLQDCSGQPVIGYRAASFSFSDANPWVHDALAESGYRYSSSIYPVKHDLYGMPRSPRFPYRPGSGALLEIPITTLRLSGRNLPCGGGGYFRLLPYELSRLLLRRVNEIDKASAVFYFHPWEIDPEQPRQRGLALKSRFRHYVNLRRMESKLTRLLNDFNWDRIDKIHLPASSLPASHSQTHDTACLVSAPQA